MKEKKNDRFLLETRKEEIKKCFDTEWINEVSKKEKKRPDEVWKEIEDNFKGITYDLRLGEQAFTSTKKLPENVRKKGYIQIEPGETALLITYEKVDIPEDYMAFLSLRTAHASKGLINISGFHVDPNWKGKLVFSVYNSAPRPVVLGYKERIYHMFVVQMSGRAWPQKKCEPLYHQRRESMSFYNMERLPSEFIESIKGPPISLTALDERLKRTETLVRVLITIFAGILIALVGYLLAG